MGLFKDARELSKMGREMQKDYDPAAQVRAATAQMQSAAAPLTTGVVTKAIVISLGDTGTMVNQAPVMNVELTVLPDASPAYAATAQTYGHAVLATIAPGQLTHVKVDPADPRVVALA